MSTVIHTATRLENGGVKHEVTALGAGGGGGSHMQAVVTHMSDMDFRLAVMAQLAEVRRLLTPAQPKREPLPPTLPLKAFCARLNRSVYWGYDMIRRRKLVPIKTGKPYEIPVEQLKNFLPRSSSS